MNIGYENTAEAPCRLTGVYEDFQRPLGYEIILNAAGAKNMNHANLITFFGFYYLTDFSSGSTPHAVTPSAIGQ